MRASFNFCLPAASLGYPAPTIILKKQLNERKGAARQSRNQDQIGLNAEI